MIELLSSIDAWAALFTLTALEIVLGIDNLVFIALLTSPLDAARAKRARAVGLSLAFIFRVLLLSSLSAIMGMTRPIIAAGTLSFSWRDIILVGGGLFLIAKATWEIHNEVEGEHDGGQTSPRRRALPAIIFQLALVDLVFSIDSIVTAIGLAEHLEVMIAAVVIAMVVMFIASEPVGRFIAAHPTSKMLALGFLLLIGAALLADGFHFHVPRGYIYSAMAFAAAVEVFNVLARRNRKKRQGRSQ